MIYYIDANNIAGKMGILGEKNFDQKLISLVKGFFSNTNHRVRLVFDGFDAMGDAYGDSRIKVYYAPKDAVNPNGADDKIINLLVNDCQDDEMKGQVICLVTDDIDLKNEFIRIVDNLNIKTKCAKASVFASGLIGEVGHGNNIKEGLTSEIADKITDELMNLWT